MIKGLIHQEDITIINIYTLDGAPKYIKQILTDIKGEKDNNTIIVRDFSTSLSTMNRSYSEKINQEILNLTLTLDKISLTDMDRTFHPTAAEYAFFLRAHGTFYMVHQMIDHKTSLNKFKKIATFIFCDNSKLKINKRKAGKINMWKLNLFLNNQYQEHT